MISLVSFVLALTLEAQIKQIAARIDARVGVAAIDLDNGRTFSYRGDESFPMASVFKLPLAVQVLHSVDAGALRLDQSYTLSPADLSFGHSPIRDHANGQPVTTTLRELIVAAVSESDNTAGDYLLRMVTPPKVTERMHALGAKGIRVDRPENDIIPTFSSTRGIRRYARDRRDTATPNAAVALLRALYERRDQLSPSSHDFLVSVLTNSHNPVRLGKLLPSGVSVAHKTGTMPGTMNDIGIVTSGDRHIAIAIFTKAGFVSPEARRERAISEIARAIFENF